jgi:hypothetical protein
MRRAIYLDTTLWNKLCEHAIDAAILVDKMRRNNAEIVFSPHLRFELAKTFRSVRSGKREKAIILFKYLETFINLRMRCVKQVVDLLREEVRHANGETKRVECFYDHGEYEREAAEIQKLARGELDSGIERVLEFRSSQVQEFRDSGPARADAWRKLSLLNPEESLASFVEQMRPAFGRRGLEKHISSLFPELRPRDVRRLAGKLFCSRRYRLAQALMRGDLYLDWLCFRNGGLKRDSAEDCYHIENAAYCQFYATDDVAQNSYAGEILTITNVRIHDRTTKLLSWLTSDAFD